MVTIQATRYAVTLPGIPPSVAQARHAVARFLGDHPRAEDAVLVVSELAANAVVHSRSRGRAFTVRAEVFRGYLWAEVEDLGGPWIVRQRGDGRPHGLAIVHALAAGARNWGIELTDSTRVVWARLDTWSAACVPEAGREPKEGSSRPARSGTAGLATAGLPLPPEPLSDEGAGRRPPSATTE